MAAAITTSATSLEGQALECIRELQSLELAIPEADRPNNATIAVDFEALTATLSVTLPVTLNGAGAAISITASPYLS
ncbi:hypothetical protein L3556_06375 [Candidatus Synechococcus calcipolaris G9]|uniref:Uncharacterized protein n=1 Tax=Candidatus Synechococcus calcipolaris G9 TaxID=1497997 RepID=A0ABT6EYV5_9SYNE|nr:hypothetical protein [Candidatus Synechococcus calcipolaris]MDG2990561.1 hypothetical protein [Candidatus Synechococcus calcipolaris G9]